MNLTIKQEKFCQKYVETGNASGAYRQSYDCQKMKPETINRTAKSLLDNPKIATRLEELHAIHMKRHEVTVDRIVAELEKMAFLDVRRLYHEDGTFKKITELDRYTAAGIASLEIEELCGGTGKDRVVIGHTKKIKLTDKKGALDSLARVFGAFQDKKHVVVEDYEGMLERLAREESEAKNE